MLNPLTTLEQSWFQETNGSNNGHVVPRSGPPRIGLVTNLLCTAATQESSLQPPVLYSHEGYQVCRLVREVLTELDLVYELLNAGKESPRRAELASNTGGSSHCPYLSIPILTPKCLKQPILLDTATQPTPSGHLPTSCCGGLPELFFHWPNHCLRH